MLVWIAIFSNGTCKILNGWIPVGGQVDPSSIVGDSLVWEKAPEERYEAWNFWDIK
jgi:hypothetical protein